MLTRKARGWLLYAEGREKGYIKKEERERGMR